MNWKWIVLLGVAMIAGGKLAAGISADETWIANSEASVAIGAFISIWSAIVAGVRHISKAK
ncbi:MAG: hypothetical protein R3D27_14010 [Hyphomicrobiaceae bacterium]